MAYEKADFYSAYGFYAVDPDTGIRYAGARIPEFPDQSITLRLHYHPFLYRKVALQKAQQLVDKEVVSSESKIIIAGGAYGWLGEALEVLVPGCQCVSVDTSQYVQDSKEFSPDDELIESIRASGFDETEGVGLFLFNKFSDSTPRAIVPILQEDLLTEESRNRTIASMGGTPTLVITEEVWQILPQESKDAYEQAASDLGIEITHIIDGVMI